MTVKFKYEITVYHVYQDKHHPMEQRITTTLDYSMRYALFMALIASGKDFSIQLKGETKK